MHVVPTRHHTSALRREADASEKQSKNLFAGFLHFLCAFGKWSANLTEALIVLSPAACPPCGLPAQRGENLGKRSRCGAVQGTS